MASFHHLDHAELDQIGRAERSDASPGERDGALGHLAALGAQQVGDRLQRGGLAGAVGAQERDDAALLDLQRDALQHQDDVVVHDLDVADRKQRPGRLRGALDPARQSGGGHLAARPSSTQLVQSRGVMPCSFAYCAADASIIGRTTSFIGVIQSETNDHFSPSHCWTRTAWLPSWSAQVTLSGGVKSDMPSSASRSSVMFRFSRPSRTCSPVSGCWPCSSWAVRMASATITALIRPRL